MQSSSLPSHWNLDKILDDLNDAGFALIDEVYALMTARVPKVEVRESAHAALAARGHACETLPGAVWPDDTAT